eukprot:scaffold898_cov120-Skeletonema_marinoi.AAC.8
MSGSMSSMSGSWNRLTSKPSKARTSKTSISMDSGSPSLSDTPPSSPPTRLLRVIGDTSSSSQTQQQQQPTTISVEFPRERTFSRGSSTSMGPPTVESNSSMDSVSTGFTQSPSSTPPKKTWERNYKSFLRRSGGGGHGGGSSRHHHHVNNNPPTPAPAMLPAPRLSSGSSTFIHLNSKRSSAPSFPTNAADLAEIQKAADLAAELEAGDVEFGDDDWATNPPPPHLQRQQSVPSSPTRSSHKEHSSRGGSFFRKLRSKTKSEDSLDSTMRKGRDRRSPTTTTPPGSDASLSSRNNKHSPTSIRRRTTGVQDGLERAAVLSETLGTPVLSISDDLTPPFIPDQLSGGGGGATAIGAITMQPLKDDNRKPRPRGLTSDENSSLDGAMHRGHHTTSGSNSGGGKSKLSKSPFNRVKSMGGGLTIKEGEPTVISNEQEAQMREKRKAFTDFHNMGVDSTSAFLGDESSNHRNSFFLTSVAYPAANARVLPTNNTRGGAQSYDKKTTISPSTSENALKAIGAPKDELDNSADIAPERALRPVRGPESWKKGERHSIIPAILCVCPFQVLSNVMSDDSGNPPSRPPSGQSLLSSSPINGYGIGSMIADDEHNESNQNGWFFADHHQPQPRLSSNKAGVPPSAFGKIMLGKATVAALGVRSFFNEVYGWTSGIFVLRQNYLFEYRDDDNLKGLPWGYAHLQLAEAYPHKHFVNALHLDFFEKPCIKSGKRSLLLRVEDKGERDRWVSLLQAAARTTIHDLYDVDVSGGPEFGRGRYAVVRPARRRQTRRVTSHDGLRIVSSVDNLSGTNKDTSDSGTGYDCALKIINKKEFWSRVKKGAERADTLVREAAVQTTLGVQGSDTPGFLRLRSIFETGEEFVLELELLEGTDLFQHVSSRGTLDEVEAAQVMRDLLHCLDVMDQIGIAHRDIKPANLLMCDENCGSGCKIKMADFGMASFVGVDNLVRGRCGTPGFVAPEILRTAVNSGYGNKVDMFSAGVTLYVMLAGYEPFYGESDAELISANKEAKVDFPKADWHKISVEGRDLIEKMLIVDPSARISPADALRHPWITRRAA